MHTTMSRALGWPTVGYVRTITLAVCWAVRCDRLIRTKRSGLCCPHLLSRQRGTVLLSTKQAPAVL
jgi:hypothetical protein